MAKTIKAKNGKKPQHILNKNVCAIHAYCELSLIEQKIINALLYNAVPGLKERKTRHTIHIGELSSLIGYKSTNHMHLRESLKNLISKVFEWNILEDNTQETWQASAMLASVSITGPMCTYTYSEHLAEHLANPNIYGRIDMKLQAKFKSSYGLRLYENCIRHQNIAEMRWLEIWQLRKLMGVDEKLYPIFRDFKRRVIERAVKEVNEISPVKLEIEYKKRGRETVAVKFYIIRETEPPPLFEKLLEAPEQIEVRKREVLQQELIDLGLSIEDSDATFSEYGREYIEEKIKLVKGACRKQEIKSPVAFFKAALKKNFLSSSAISAKETKKTKEKEAEEKANAALNEEYMRYLLGQVPKKFKELSEEELATLEEDKAFFSYLGVLSNVYVKEGVENPLVAKKTTEYVATQKTSLIKKWGLKGLDEFKDQAAMQGVIAHG